MWHYRTETTKSAWELKEPPARDDSGRIEWRDDIEAPVVGDDDLPRENAPRWLNKGRRGFFITHAVALILTVPRP